MKGPGPRLPASAGVTSIHAIDQLVREHSAVSALIALLDATLLEARAGHAVDDRLILEAISQLMEFTERDHHVREDLAVEAAAVRLPALRTLQRELRAQHVAVRERAAAVRAALKAGVADAAVSRPQLAVLGLAYTTEARRNMAFEEVRVFPELAGALDQDTWAAIEVRIDPGSARAGGTTAADHYDRTLRALAERFVRESPAT